MVEDQAESEDEEANTKFKFGGATKAAAAQDDILKSAAAAGATQSSPRSKNEEKRKSVMPEVENRRVDQLTEYLNKTEE